MTREIHGLVARTVATGDDAHRQQVFVKDAVGGVIIGLSRTAHDAWLTPEEARLYARQILAAAKRVEKHLTDPQQLTNKVDT